MSDLNEVYMKVISGDAHAFYVTREWKDKRLEILERDNYICQRCIGHWTEPNKPIKKIKLSKAKYVHHIKPMKDYFELALNNDNLISLCFNCHEVIEERQGNKFKPIKKRLTDEKW